MKTRRIVRLHTQPDDFDPAIWRQVEGPQTITLSVLHAVIQSVMGFEDHHLFQFEVEDQRYGIPHPGWDDGVGDARNTWLKALIARGMTLFRSTYD
jgi:hypothetical protein